ncbi:MAG TPA: hypothetical protein VKA26_01570 [Ignavibacteriaceae bacterium]|nr:hypothetical protein [Ignavibacteriaceae bacterium]
MKFGDFIKELRLKSGLGLREFCKKYGHDASNWSKIERSILLPPSDEKTLIKWAKELKIEKNSTDWFTFFDLASASRGEIPADILTDENIVAKLPLFYRTLRGQKPTTEEMKNLAKLLKQN